MSVQTWLIYISFVLAATATPGPAVLFIVTHATLQGWRKSVFAALGNITGLLCLGAIAVTGLGAVLNSSIIVFKMIKWLGAAYLIYIGIMLIRRKDGEAGLRPPSRKVMDMPPHRLFFQALGVALSNPKAILFLTALFPQFININHALLPQFALLIATLMSFSFFFLMLYAALADRVRIWLAAPGRITVFNRTTGSLFIGFGVLLASSKR